MQSQQDSSFPVLLKLTTGRTSCNCLLIASPRGYPLGLSCIKHSTKPPSAVVLTGISTADKIATQLKQRCL